MDGGLYSEMLLGFCLALVRGGVRALDVKRTVGICSAEWVNGFLGCSLGSRLLKPARISILVWSVSKNEEK